MLIDTHTPTSTAPPENIGPSVERPVFLDERGRRARRFGHLARTIALLTAVWLTSLVVGPLGFLGLPALPGGLLAARLPPGPTSPSPSEFRAGGPLLATPGGLTKSRSLLLASNAQETRADVRAQSSRRRHPARRHRSTDPKPRLV